MNSKTPDDAAAPRAGGLGRVVEAGLNGEAVTAGGVLAAIGGWRGVFESLAPATVYLITYALTRDAYLSVVAPLALAVLGMVIRLIRREPLTAVFSGMLGVLVCAAAVLFTGEGSSYYLPGFWINGAWIAGHLISLLVGWPLIGLLLGFLRGSLTEWRTHRALRRAAAVCTLVWIALFAARLAVQVPLYLADGAGQPGAFEALGIARLVMGVPLFALAVVFTWLILSRVNASVPAYEKPRMPGEQDAFGGDPGDADRSSDE